MGSQMNIICSAVVLFCFACCAAAAAVVVNTEEGPVAGVSASAWDEFKGVPFAEPPKRFMPPKDPASRSVTYDASNYKSACLQPGRGSEDCLYLNIFRPHTATTKAAVMVWIHGGAYVSGAGSDFNGEFLSNGSNTIVVTINYRLGAFGFLALNELKTRDNTTGNYGHQDQRMAMKWVFRNIHYFGGDPSKITISGESAGAHSTCVHLGDKKTQPYFRGGIVESTYIDCQIRTLAAGNSDGVALAAAFGCGGTGALLLNCLSSANAASIVQSYNGKPGAYFTPCLDGFDLTEQPFDVIKSGEKVPVLLGTNLNEDVTFHCTSEHLADLVASGKKVYFYRFDYPPAQHASELVFLWGHGSLKDAGAIKLSLNMRNFWISFVENQVPISSGALAWPEYTVPARQYIILNSELSHGQSYTCQ